MNHIYILIIFFLFVGPGPTTFFINPYTVAFNALLSLIAVLYLLRSEIKATNFELLLKSPSLYKYYQSTLQLSIVAMAVMSVAVSLLWSRPIPTIVDDMLMNYAMMPINVVLLAPILEEIVYRKIIFTWVSGKTSFWVGASISSLIFAVCHLDIARLPAYFAVGLIFCYFYRRSGSILVPIAAHVSLNLISIITRTIG